MDPLEQIGRIFTCYICLGTTTALTLWQTSTIIYVLHLAKLLVQVHVKARHSRNQLSGNTSKWPS